MDRRAAAATRLAEQLAALAALCLGFRVGRVQVECGDQWLAKRSGDLPSERLTASVERLDFEVMASGAARTVENLLHQPVDHQSDSDFGSGPSRGAVSSSAPGSYAAVPVRAAERVLGVVSVADPAARTVGPEQLRVLTQLAELLAVQLAELLSVDGSRRTAVDDGVVAEIAAGLSADEFRPWYQPIVELRTERLVGVEALARWHHRDGAVLVPAAFLPAAERSDLVVDLDRAIWRHALADLARWQQVRPDFRLSVNVSGRHLDRPTLAAEVDSAVAAAAVDPTSVVLEITETVRPEDSDVAREVITSLRSRGYTVWFDDFGSGWSALRDLIALPVSGIKLDVSFASRLGTPIDDALIGALTAAADQVGWAVVIEGVERPEQLERARELGCHYGQGHYWARACPPGDVPGLLGDGGRFSG